MLMLQFIKLHQQKQIWIKMKRIDINTIRVVKSFGYSKSGLIFYKDLNRLKSKSESERDKVNCYIHLKGKYSNGDRLNAEFKISYKSYLEIMNSIFNSVISSQTSFFS